MKSRVASYEILAPRISEPFGSLPRAWLIACESVTSPRVYPSGAARAIISVPMMVEAPGRLSTMIGCLRLAETTWDTARAAESALPPAGYGTMIRIGLDGHSCADAASGVRANGLTADRCGDA